MATSAHLVLLLCFTSVLLHRAFCQTQNPPNSSLRPVNEICMGCICEASSGCDRTLACHDGVCGLFGITRPYWMDAGKPVIRGDDRSRPGAFERCTTDPVCAANTVQGYMAEYSKDCDGNGVISCQDFAALHSLGAGCIGKVDRHYKQQLDRCLVRLMPVKT